MADRHGKVAAPQHVLLVDSEPARAALLEQALKDAGYTVDKQVHGDRSLARLVAESQPDMIIIDIDAPDRDVLEQMTQLSRSNPRPVVMYADEDDTAFVEQAIQSGVSAYVANGMRPDRVKATLSVAVARFREFQNLRQELDHARTELADRKLIEKAKGLIMTHRGVNEDDAYRALRKMAMDRSCRLSDVARNVIDIFDITQE
ncbi:MAG: ANTAR domain-containing protein [Natronospirillum sp.]|uniref:ANTAR domain-containing response regulator n=1 Tax=Natronospirillum sp. TaxID=2812955 RepID=UPI0025D46274|nr:ANTAR domain-containing protein [Natronospirillum sp.]MCH8553061.1 ANTAR domain-containing protein [Natronospirillum sp.]